MAMASPQTETATDVVVVGTGPAGLAVSACLHKAGIDYLILEREQVIAPSWRRHYDRLHLHTDRQHSGLPHYPMPASFPRYPSRDQVIAYLEDYARMFSITPRFGEDLIEARQSEGAWELRTSAARYRTQALVLATGYNAAPVHPQWPGMENYQGSILHSSEYRSGALFRGLDVLVVGFGNSGGEIAIDLVEQGARPSLAIRSPVNLLPRELLGLPILTWALVLSRLPPRVADTLSAPLLRMTFGSLSRLGLQKASAGPMEELRMRKRVPLIDVGTVDLIRRKEIQVRPGISEFTPKGVRFDDGNEESYQAVVLATGYRHQLAKVLGNLEGLVDAAGQIMMSGRETALPHLYLCGFDVAPTGMLREAGIEARRITDSLTRRLNATASLRA